MATGLTKNQAKTFMQKYLDTNLPSYPGVYYGTYGGSPSSHCYEVTFVNSQFTHKNKFFDGVQKLQK